MIGQEKTSFSLLAAFLINQKLPTVLLNFNLKNDTTKVIGEESKFNRNLKICFNLVKGLDNKSTVRLA